MWIATLGQTLFLSSWPCFVLHLATTAKKLCDCAKCTEELLKENEGAAAEEVENTGGPQNDERLDSGRDLRKRKASRKRKSAEDEEAIGLLSVEEHGTAD